MKRNYEWAVTSIDNEEKVVSSKYHSKLEQSRSMTIYLMDCLDRLKEDVLKYGFADQKEEISFFKVTKPNVLGKLIYYNKVYRLEISNPVDSRTLFTEHYVMAFEELKQVFDRDRRHSSFYNYYRSGRTDLDTEYFLTGKKRLDEYFNSYEFTLDKRFTTYYDEKVARYIADDLTFKYLEKIISGKTDDSEAWDDFLDSDIFWTDTQNALIEFLYGMHVRGSISHGKIPIAKLIRFFEKVLKVELSDPYHAFHRMKVRAGSKTPYLDGMANDLKEYMNKNL